MSEPRKPVDWEAVEAEFRTGTLSTREIARQFAVTETAIRKRAKAHGWERDLSDKVRVLARAKMVRSLGSQGGSQEQRARTESQTIEQAAERQVQASREHHTLIRRGQDLTVRLLDELDAATSHVGELSELIEAATTIKAADGGEKIDFKRRNAMMKAIELPSRATVVKDLSAAAKNWIGLDRINLGIDEPNKQKVEHSGSLAVRKDLNDLTDEDLVAIAASGSPGASDPP